MKRFSIVGACMGLGLVVAAQAARMVVEGDELSASAALGRVLDREGVAARRPALEPRWGAVDRGVSLAVGDWLRVGKRGANALKIGLTGPEGEEGAQLILGPGCQIEILGLGRVRLLSGELEVDALESAPVAVVGPGESSVQVSGRDVLRALERDIERLAKDPGWLGGYKGNGSTEALGSLLANVDGRNVPLTIGYHKVTVDVRDQIARTVIEESFINQTSSVLEGVFYFPLPADASISGFGMWINGELVQGDIVEKQRAREIYETILREKRDPGLLEWTGGNIFKARVYPIGAEKRIRIAYTQVLSKVGDTYAYNYALQSEMLRLTPLKQLEITVNVASRQSLAAVECPSHTCRIQSTEHAAKVEFSAEEYAPERDFELRVRNAPTDEKLTLVSHRRGEDGYFMLLVDGPEVVSADVERSPIELLVLADTSGSMDGTPRASQLAVIETLVSALGEGDTFNIATCDVETHWMADRSLTSTPESQSAALDFVEARDPLGWSQLEGAFASAIERAGPSTHVVYIGDGVPTSGSADPVALARSLARTYTGQGSFHAIVPGSSSEPVVLRALASLGGGSVRSIGGGTDPSQAAFALLHEISSPVLRDLKLDFGGIPVAAVYPRDLPNLPMGGQHVVVGRFDPAAVDLAGTLHVSGRFGDREVRFESPVDLDAEGEGNSFVPRLWARHHLDELLAQGRSQEVRDRIIALSEDFQIVTPYSSFLVLESEADRERFGVTKSLRIRDGEEFFSAGRSEANHALVRQQMLAAKGWRVNLRAAVLQRLSEMGRDLTLRLDGGGIVPMPGDGMGALGYAGGEVFDASPAPEGQMRTMRSSNVAGDSQPSEDMPPTLDLMVKRDARADGDEVMEEELAPMASSRLSNSAPMEKKAVAERHRRSDESFVGVRQRRRLTPPQRPQRSAFEALFPSVGSPRVVGADLKWPAEVAEILSGLDRRPALAASDAVWRFQTEGVWTEARGRSSVQRGQWWIGRDSWLIRSPHVQGQEYLVEWVEGGERGVLQEGWRLGRTRPALPLDREAWRAPVEWSFGDRLRGYGLYEAHLERIEGERAFIEFRGPNAVKGSGTWSMIEVDLTRKVVVAETWSDGWGGEVKWSFGDFQEVGGHWWPGTIRSWQTKDPNERTTRLTVEVTPGGDLSELAAPDLARRDDAVLLPEAKPELAAAKQAVAGGDADLAHRWALLEHFARNQRWDSAREHIEAIETLFAGKPGWGPIFRTWLRESRRNEELRTELLRAARALVDQPRDGEFGLANRLLGFANVLHSGDELLELFARLRPLLARQDAILDATLDLDRRELNALAQTNRSEVLFQAEEQAAQRWPHVWDLQNRFAEAAARRGFVDRALAHLVSVEDESGPWSDSERIQMRLQQLEICWGNYRLKEVVRRAEAWDAGEIVLAEASIYDRYLSALVFLGREDSYAETLDRWLAHASDPARDEAASIRMGVAISHCLGQGHHLYQQRFSEFDLVRLTACARALVKGDAALDTATRILRNHLYRQTTQGQQLLTELFVEASENAHEVRPQRLSVLLAWTVDARWVSERFEEEWRALIEKVFVRWSAETESVARELLGELVLRYGDEDQRLRYRRQMYSDAGDEEDDAARIAAARLLFHQILSGPWTAEAQAEAIALFPGMAVDDGSRVDIEASTDQRIVALHRLVDWILASRTQQQLQDLPGFEGLSRRTLESERERIHVQVRAETSELMGRLESILEPQDLARWAAIERLYLDVRGRMDLDGAWSRAVGMLIEEVDGEEASAGTADANVAATRLRLEILLARLVDTCSHLLVSTPAETGRERLGVFVPLLERLAQRKSDLRDGRLDLRDLWIALDRGDELEAQLAEWFGEGDDFALMTWGRDYAHVLAERGKLARAAEVLEQIARVDDLETADFDALARWYTALDDRAGARSARRRGMARMSEYELAGQLGQSLQKVQRGGSDIPEELDEDVSVMLQTLLRKAQNPEHQLWVLRELYSVTKDFRLLECLAEAVQGQTAQRIYPMLEQIGGLSDLIDEEATLDRLLKGVAAVREQAPTPVDRRALWLLELQLLPKAAQQSHGAGPHEQRVLHAMRSAFDGEWQAGEPLLMAGLLTSQGLSRDGVLAEERLRQLRALADLAGDPDEKLAVRRHLAQAQWSASRPDAAIQTLIAALAQRRAQTGVLPQSARDSVAELSNWLSSRGSFAAAERLWNEELGTVVAPLDRLWMEERLGEVYLAALRAGGQVSLGQGETLSTNFSQRLRTSLQTRSNEHHAANQLRVLCDLWRQRASTGDPKGASAEAADFAFGGLMRVVELYQYRSGQQMIGLIADWFTDSQDPTTAIVLLMNCAENEPAWLQKRGEEFWAQHAWRLANSLSKAGKLDGRLERRVLNVVLAELREDLSSFRSRNRSIYDSRHHTFWSAKRADFLAIALEIAGAPQASSRTILYGAEYLHDGLGAHGMAIDVLLAGYRRGVLDHNARARLANYLQMSERWKESLPVVEGLIAEAEGRVDYRAMAILAHARLGNRGAALEALAVAEGWFREHDKWQEGVIATLAQACRNARLPEQSLPLYGDAIALHTRSRQDRGNGDGVLSRYYREQSDVFAQLGRTSEAVDAAAGAIVAWGSGTRQRAAELENLTSILSRASDLDGYVRELNGRVLESGLENPILRRAVGQVYLQRKNAPAAAEQFALALEARPDDLENHRLMVEALDRMDRPKVAAAALLEWARQAGHEWNLYTQLGRRLELLGQNERAERAFTTLVELSPNESEGHAALAQVREGQRRWSDSAAEWRHVIRIRTAEPVGYVGLARSLVELEDYAQARELIRKLQSEPWPEHFHDVQAQAEALLERIR